MAASIATTIIACLKFFNDFVAETKNLPSPEATKLGLSPAAWEDELGRLRMWAANIGAHQTGQSSLDFRLRDSSHIREQIMKLLQDLLERLHDARAVIASDDKDDKDGECGEDFSDDEDPTTEIQELRGNLATLINCLFQMSMLVRKPAQHDMIIGSKRADTAMFEPFDLNHVRDKYPKAEKSIVERLGLAVSRRRKYLKYRERHAMKLKQGISKIIPENKSIENSHEGGTMQGGTVSLLSDTIATDLRNSNIRFDDGASDSGVSQTSYAQTLLCGGNITIPRPPKASHGGLPFECPYCYFVIAVKGRRSWNRHVFNDLQPYVCIAPTCATSDKLYATRHEWLHHLKIVHPTESCIGVQEEEISLCLTCPLCKDDIDTEKHYDRHVARHLQELALFILPRSEDDSDASEDDPDSNIDSGAESDASDDVVQPASHCRETLDHFAAQLMSEFAKCKDLLHEEAFEASVSESRYQSQYGPMQDLLHKLEELDVGGDEDLSTKRKSLMGDTKQWLDALSFRIHGPIRPDSDKGLAPTGESNSPEPENQSGAHQSSGSMKNWESGPYKPAVGETESACMIPRDFMREGPRAVLLKLLLDISGRTGCHIRINRRLDQEETSVYIRGVKTSREYAERVITDLFRKSGFEISFKLYPIQESSDQVDGKAPTTRYPNLALSSEIEERYPEVIFAFGTTYDFAENSMTVVPVRFDIARDQSFPDSLYEITQGIGCLIQLRGLLSSNLACIVIRGPSSFVQRAEGEIKILLSNWTLPTHHQSAGNVADVPGLHVASNHDANADTPELVENRLKEFENEETEEMERRPRQSRQGYFVEGSLIETTGYGTAPRLKGIVKWLNVSKGLGLIRPVDGSEEIYVPISEMRCSGFETLAEAQQVEFEIQDEQKGPNAANVTFDPKPILPAKRPSSLSIDRPANNQKMKMPNNPEKAEQEKDASSSNQSKPIVAQESKLESWIREPPSWARFWTCGNCAGARIRVRLHHCIFCYRPRDQYASYEG